MARSIASTPVLKGNDAKRFLEKMVEPPSKKEVEFLQKAKKAYKSNPF
jgi:hypothetical protein